MIKTWSISEKKRFWRAMNYKPGRDKFKSFRIDNPGVGEYQLCFDNSFSYQTRKVVFFEVYHLSPSFSFPSRFILYDKVYLYDANGTLEEEDITKYARNDPALAKQLEQIGMTVVQFHVRKIVSFARLKFNPFKESIKRWKNQWKSIEILYFNYTFILHLIPFTYF